VNDPSSSLPARATEQSQLATLFDLGRQVTSVLDIEELLQQIPLLIARLIDFDAFAVYLLDRRRTEMTIAYAVGYPEHEVRSRRIKVGEGLVGRVVERREVLLAGDLAHEPHYVPIVPGMMSTVVVPLVSKGRPVGALNILSHEAGAFSDREVPILRQFGAHVAVAIENARLFERERRDAQVFETLGEIAREFSSILDVDELLTHIARLTRRLVDYRTLGILLLNEQTQELEMRLALQYDERVTLPKVKLGEGLVGCAALLKQPVYVPDVSKDPRYIKVVEDVRSELALPLLVKDRCIGVLDLESPVLDAFDKWHVEVLTLLASHAAVALENARLYETVRTNEERLDREVRFAQRVQAALLPTSLPKRLRGVDVAARFAPARELGGDFYDYLSAEPYTLVVAVGDVSGKGVPAALYSAFAGELVRSRTFRRRYTSERTNPAAVLAAMNTILHERQLEEYYCTLCYASFDLRRRAVTFANSGLPYPVRATADGCAQVELPGVPLGALPGTAYDEVAVPLAAGDVFVFCSDGVFEAEDAAGLEFGAERLLDVVSRTRTLPARAVVDAIFEEVERFRGEAAQNDDMTAVAVRITT
jgi:sigma-B regulation protein RsbU (phosphoserine phosphatase)